MHFRHGSWPEELAIWRTALAAGGAQVEMPVLPQTQHLQVCLCRYRDSTEPQKRHVGIRQCRRSLLLGCQKVGYRKMKIFYTIFIMALGHFVDPASDTA